MMCVNGFKIFFYERKHARERGGGNMNIYIYTYGVATVSRFDKIIGLFCRILALL